MIDPVELERLLDSELKQLPLPRAPETLLPRVMAAAGPWYRRPWVTWPAVWQGASAVLLASLVAGLALLIPAVQHASGAVASRMPVAVPRSLVDIVRRATEAAALMRVVSQVLLQPIALYVLALAISLSVAGAALWSALNHFAPGEASHQ